MQGALPAHVPHERRLNWGLQSTVTGLPIYPVPKESIFHRSINQNDEFGLWVDFGRWRPPDPMKQQAYLSTLEHMKPRRRFGTGSASATQTQETQRSEDDLGAAHRPAPLVRFVGYAKWHMDGRTLTEGELDRLMHQHSQQKYPCSRPATYEEYSTGRIVGLPMRNDSGFDACFVGPNACCAMFKNAGACHDTLGFRKKVVLTGDDFDGRVTETGAMWGEKTVVCVVPVARFFKQQSLTTHGQLRGVLDGDGRMGLRRSKSWSGGKPTDQAITGGSSKLGAGASKTTGFSKTVSSDGFKVLDSVTGKPQLWKPFPNSANASTVKRTLNDGRMPGVMPSHAKREPTDQNFSGGEASIYF